MYILKYAYIVILVILTLFLRLYLFVIKKIKTQEEYDKRVYKIVNRWAAYMLKVVGVNIKVIGRENIPKTNCLFVSNHQGNLDFLVLMSVLDKHLGFLAKNGILKIPIIRTWMKDMHCVFIDRENIRESLKAIKNGIENLEKGYSMLIFPEGTRSKSHELGSFKKGSLKMATKSEALIVPIAIDNTFEGFEAVHGKLKSVDVTMSILKPIDPKSLSKEEKGNLAEIIKTEIEKELKSIVNK